MKIACMEVLGYTEGGTKDSIVRCITNHRHTWGGTEFHTYEYNSEGFAITLVTNQYLGDIGDIDGVAQDIIVALETASIECQLGRTDLEPVEIDMSDGTGEDATIVFLGYLPGSNYLGTEYYEELSDPDMIVEDWNGDCPV